MLYASIRLRDFAIGVLVFPAVTVLPGVAVLPGVTVLPGTDILPGASIVVEIIKGVLDFPLGRDLIVQETL